MVLRLDSATCPQPEAIKPPFLYPGVGGRLGLSMEETIPPSAFLVEFPQFFAPTLRHFDRAPEA